MRELRHRRGQYPPTTSAHRLQRGLPGYLILFAPHAFASQCQSEPESRFRLWCSSQYLRISPLHWEFRFPLSDSSYVVSDDLPWLSQGLSHRTYITTYMLFTPNDFEQRLHPPYYRGCWHGVSRCFLCGYRQQ